MPRRPSAGQYLSGSRAVIKDYPAGTDAVAVGDIVRLTADVIDNVTGEVDPNNLLGIAKSKTGTGPRIEPIDPSRILVELFTDDVAVWFEGTRAPLATDVGKNYGLVQAADGVWIVDATDTVNTRVRVVDVSLTRNAWFCVVLAASRQSLVGT